MKHTDEVVRRARTACAADPGGDAGPTVPELRYAATAAG
jgi:hypothetical protein